MGEDVKNWIFRGNDRGYFCPHCQSRCLCGTDGDWLPSSFCPHCGKPVGFEVTPVFDQPVAPLPLPYQSSTAAYGGWLM